MKTTCLGWHPSSVDERHHTDDRFVGLLAELPRSSGCSCGDDDDAEEEGRGAAQGLRQELRRRRPPPARRRAHRRWEKVNKFSPSPCFLPFLALFRIEDGLRYIAVFAT
ncbi:hypothetical protein GW17_00045514 [Ensete ventricosum]|nr:hypothetical protein GW17_00045514 [Ensete ventricosum]